MVFGVVAEVFDVAVRAVRDGQLVMHFLVATVQIPIIDHPFGGSAVFFPSQRGVVIVQFARGEHRWVDAVAHRAL